MLDVHEIDVFLKCLVFIPSWHTFVCFKNPIILFVAVLVSRVVEHFFFASVFYIGDVLLV